MCCGSTLTTELSPSPSCLSSICYYVCVTLIQSLKKKKASKYFSPKNPGDWGQDREAVTDACGGGGEGILHGKTTVRTEPLPGTCPCALCPPAAVPRISCCGWCPYSGLSKGSDWYTFFFLPHPAERSKWHFVKMERCTELTVKLIKCHAPRRRKTGTRAQPRHRQAALNSAYSLVLPLLCQ